MFVMCCFVPDLTDLPQEVETRKLKKQIDFTFVVSAKFLMFRADLTHFHLI